MSISYKILLPVTTNPELVQQKLIDIPDLSKLIMVNNFELPEVHSLSLEAKSKGAEVYYQPENAGLAPSWNLGMKRMIEDNCEFVVILSVSAIFDKPLQEFIDFVVDHETNIKPMCRYVASDKATLHCFAQTAKSVEMGGYFDENFWPIYFEDTDYSKRSKHNGVCDLVKQCQLNDVVHSKEYCIAMKNKKLFSMFQRHAHRQSVYYLDKWGGTHNNEKFNCPFNDPNIPINEWQLQPGVPKAKWKIL